MTLDEIIEYMLSSVPEEYDISVGSFFYDLLYPVAEQIYLLQKRIQIREIFQHYGSICAERFKPG